jgi:gluconolactonase
MLIAMRSSFSLLLSGLAPLLLSGLLAAQPEAYPLTADHERKAGVPEGKLTQHQWTSRIYPGTTRDYWVYVPAQYKADKPACVMIFQDGQGMIGTGEKTRWRVPVVFDNLIHKGEMPVTVGIFINPGVLPPLDETTQQARYNRSYEYDALSDRYARFLLEEILPEVSRTVNLSPDPNDRALAGSSSGAMAAFTAAWHRPDQFRRVLSFIGSYVNLRGGHLWSSMVRKTEAKPLRVFLQDGNRDLNIYSGSWWMANQDLAMALDYSGYDAKFVTGTEAHNGIHGSAILPDALRWLWREYPKPVAMPMRGGERRFVTTIADPNVMAWEMVSSGHSFTEGPAVDKDGNVFFTDVRSDKIWRVDHATGKSTLWKENTSGANGMMFGPDGRLYACQGKAKRIVAYGMDGSEVALTENTTCNDLAVTKKGEVYFTDPPNKKIWLINTEKKVVPVAENIGFPNGVVLSPDQAYLLAADSDTKWSWTWLRAADGTLTNGQPFFRLEIPDDFTRSSADGMTVDTEGHLYIATAQGLQIFDQPGRLVAILNKPQAGPLSNVVFAGPQLDTLYVTAGDKVFRRKVQRRGVNAWTLVKPPKPGL